MGPCIDRLLAMSGVPATVTELSPVTSSGSEVTEATITTPTQERVSFNFSAIMSP